MSKILDGKKGLVVGIANDHSIAWGIAKSLSDEGASMYLTYQNDSICWGSSKSGYCHLQKGGGSASALSPE